MNDLVMEKMRETSMVDLAYDLLKNQGEAMRFADIMEEVAKLKGFSDEDVERYVAQLFTELNIDGRFVRDQDRKWGLKEWYSMEEVAAFAVAANTKEDDDFDSVAEDEEFDPYSEDDEEFEGDAESDLDDVESFDYEDEESEPPFEDDMEDDKLEMDEEDEDL
ncbi:DNA-directed RNA polymerase subunit delta [Staphylospora marina]|uniref:DNA-directed RNA polymerase subunit delta n=1 Tax=Staphylospora marina TaxID=2490858 RepID=UPI0013DDCB6A|nr:DNA-directed RNA polymerase subunit delta [Staphylospora marina]